MLIVIVLHSFTSCSIVVGANSKASDSGGQVALDEVRIQIERENASVRSELVACIRFELMSLAELSTDVRASRLLSPDELLDKISAKTRLPTAQLPLRGRLRALFPSPTSHYISFSHLSLNSKLIMKW